MASEDARYRQSSQYRIWSFSRAQLSAKREKANSLARASISERLSSTSRSNSASAPTSNANTPDADGASTLPEFLTPAEEAMLVTFYTSELLRAGDHAEMSDEIKATAATFFRRFYVTNSIMTYPPQEMLIVALFYGCKAEGAFPRITDFVKNFGRVEPKEILAGEYLLFEDIRFVFDVRHPFRALRGAVMGLRRIGDIDNARIDAAERRARDILRFSPLITDAYFHYTPSQIMFAALSLADRGLFERIMQETFHFVPAQPNSGAGTPMATDTPPASTSNAGGDGDRAAIIGAIMRDKVLGTIEACREMLSKEPPERREHWSSKATYKAQLQPIRKKLNKCRDPDRRNLSELHRARREQSLNRGGAESDEDEEEGGSKTDDAAVFGDALEIRDAKRRKVGKAAAAENPFGGLL